MNQKHDFKGRLEVICGSMFSGKTEELIKRVKKVELAGKKYKIFRPKIDSRNPDDKIISHAKNEIYATIISSPEEILENCEGLDVVGIDEAQFFEQSIVKICNTLANDGYRVIVAGLDMDYKGNPFGPMPNLMACAEEVKKVHAICVETGNSAGYSFRKEDNKDLVLIGEKKEYEPLSREVFIKKMNKRER
jgi:thymidine kinase